MSSAATPRPRLPRTVYALGLVSLCTDLSSEMIVPLLPAFLAGLGAGPAFLGVLEGVAASTVAILKLFSGVLADRAPRRKPLIVLGYGLSSVARPLIAIAQAPWHVMAVRFADRAGKGVRGSPRDALIADVTLPAERGRAYGVQRALDHLGALLGPLVAFALLEWGGVSVRGVFGLAAIPAAAALVVLVFAVRERARAMPPGAGRRRVLAPPASPALRRYLIVLGVFTLAGSSELFLVLRASGLGVPTAQLPLLWAALHVVKSALSGPLGAWSDRVGRRQVIAIGFAVFAAVYVGFGVASTQWHAWALFCGFGVFGALTEGAERAFVAELAPAAERGRAFGSFYLVTGLAALPGAAIFGAVWEGVGPGAAFGLGAALAGVAAALLLTTVPADPG